LGDVWYRRQAMLPRAALWSLSLGFAVFAAGCGPTQPATTAPAATSSAAAKAAPKDAPDSGVGKHARVGAAKLVDRRSRNGLAPDMLDQVKSASAPPKTSADIYRAAAPATVIVRVKGGLGSGIIIDEAGWVLTNHHVIDGGTADDFQRKATIIVGKLSTQTGAMERTEGEYDATVYKADKLRDIALLKIDKPPKLTAVKIAKVKPVPGSSVVALGHAGAGMLWALKSGQISALGKLSEALAQLASFKDDEEGREAAKAFRKFMDTQNLGLVIQSTCNILPGDSGGPLLNDRGELIGLNVFTRKDPRAGGLLSFHVHLDEIAAFVKERPTRPAQLVPDPWLEGGGDMSLEDADLDGKVDALMLQGRKPCAFCPRQSTAVFIDADQNSFDKHAVPDDLNKVFETRDFDAEAVYLQLGSNVFVWYDSDDDGKFDKLLYDEGTTGLVSGAYDIAADGALTRDDDLARTKPFQSGLFGDNALGQRFGRITHAAFPARYTDSPAPLGSSLPDAIGHSGTAVAADLDEDGTPDAVHATTPFSKRLLIDTDENFVPSLGRVFKLSEIDHAKVDAEVAVVSQSTHMWVFYDQDDDGKFDLALHTRGMRVYAATQAWTLDASRNKTDAPEHIGRMLIRPDLLRGTSGKSLATMVKKGLLPIMSAEDDGLGSFPHPVDDHRGTAFELLEIKGMPRAVVTLVGYGSDGYLLDLDQSSGLFGTKESIDIKKRVTDGKFDAEFAYFQRNGVAWAFYDSDALPGYDRVLVSLEPRTGKVDAAYTIKGKTAQYDSSGVGGRLVRPKAFKSVLLQQRLAKAAAELFADEMVDPR
jgi:S1-C subfamily serine protease